jgi:bifunctional isochorismate lyase/aryl carrier protein
MSIPSIDPYPMPGPAELPKTAANAGGAANGTSWTLDPARAALLIHDMQERFLRPFPAGQPPVTDLVANVSRLRRWCAELGIPVSYTSRPDATSQPEGGAWVDFWQPGTAQRPGFPEFPGPLAPAPYDRVFTTSRYSAFHRTGLAELLAGEGRDQLIVCGVYAHVGVLVTACDALTRDIEVFLVADAVADLSRTHHRLALVQAAQRSAATPTTGTVLEWLSTPGSARWPSIPDPTASRGATGRQSGRSQAKLLV